MSFTDSGVTLTKQDDSPVTGSILFGDIPFTNGKATIHITPDTDNKDNGIVISNIPVGWKYTVTEQTVQGYMLIDKVNDLGSITKQTTTAVFTNEKQPEPVIQTVDVKLKKNVAGNHEFIDEDFRFTAFLTGLSPSHTYRYLAPDGKTTVEYTSDRTGSVDLELTLSADQTIIFQGLPVDSVYCFREEGGDYFSRYTVYDENNLDNINSSSGRNPEKYKSLSTANETADQGEQVTVTFTNTINKTQDISIKKVISSSEQVNNDQFGFVVQLGGLEPDSYIESDVGLLRADGAGEIEVDFVITNGGTVRFYGLPVRSTYKFTEKASSYAASYTINDLNSLNKIVSESGTNGNETEKELSTKTETVDQGEDIVIIFTNTKINHDVRVTKYVDMTNGRDSGINYMTCEFRFRVDFGNLVPNKTYSMSLTAEDTTGEIKQTFTARSPEESVTVVLKHGQTITFRGLEENVTYTVTELFDRHSEFAHSFVPSYKIISNDGAIISRQSDKSSTPGEFSTGSEKVDETDIDVNIVFTNLYEFTPYELPSSGFKDQRMNIVIAFVGMAFFASIFIISRKRRKKVHAG